MIAQQKPGEAKLKYKLLDKLVNDWKKEA